MINCKNSKRSGNNKFDFIERCVYVKCGVRRGAHSTNIPPPPAREREIRLPFTREIESTRPGFFVKLKIYANQRRSIERAARCTTRARATLPLPERGEECLSTAGNLISATLRGPEIRRRVVLFPSRVTDSIVNSHDLKKACRVFPSPSSPLFHPFTGCERNVFLFFF